MLTLDGTRGKQGDLVLRTALALSLLTGREFEVSNLCRGQPNPGLETQHLYLLKALLQTTGAEVDGMMPGAMKLRFRPGPVKAGRFHVEFGRAGSVPGILQTLIPVSLIADGSVTCTINGATDVRGEMTVDWWDRILLPFLRPYVDEIKIQVERRGYYPQGRGQVRLDCVPSAEMSHFPRSDRAFPQLDISERGLIQQVHVISRASVSLRAYRVAERQAGAFFTHLGIKDPDVQIQYAGDEDRGASITAWAEYTATRLGVSVIGEPGRTAKDVGQAAAENLHREMISDATVDPRTAEILMIWIALVGGTLCVSRFTDRMEAIYQVIEQFLPGLLSVQDRQIQAAGWDYTSIPICPGQSVKLAG